jgi:hypothetical protein
MKAMSKKYGWTVVGIYLGLSALDFPFCFLAVRWFGPERIGHLEHVIVSHVWGALESVVPGLKEKREANERLALEQGGTAGEVIGKVKEEVGKVEGGKEGSASKFGFFYFVCLLGMEDGECLDDGRLLADVDDRYLDTAFDRIWCAQVVVLFADPDYPGHHTEGRQDAARLGMEDWECHTQGLDGDGAKSLDKEGRRRDGIKWEARRLGEGQFRMGQEGISRMGKRTHSLTVQEHNYHTPLHH